MANAITIISKRAKEIKKQHPSYAWQHCIKKASADYRQSKSWDRAMHKVGKKRVTKTRTRKVKRKKTSAKKISGPFPSRRRNIHANTMGSMPKHESFLGIADATLKKELRGRMTKKLGEKIIAKDQATTKREKKVLQSDINNLRNHIVELLN